MLRSTQAPRILRVLIIGSGPRGRGSPRRAALTASFSPVAPKSVTFDGSGSSDPNLASITSYTFNFGDGSAPVTQNSLNILHTYVNSGTYTASLTVTDSYGLTSAAASVTITVRGLSGSQP